MGSKKKASSSKNSRSVSQGNDTSIAGKFSSLLSYDKFIMIACKCKYDCCVPVRKIYASLEEISVIDACALVLKATKWKYFESQRRNVFRD